MEHVERARSRPSGAPADVEQRHALVLGDGPRIAPLRLEELSQDALEISWRMTAAASAGAPIRTLADLPEIVPTMLRHPELFRRHNDLGLMLLGEGALAPRDRELAVLRVAWLCQAPYEWGEHVKVAKRAGITSEEIERVTAGPSAPDWNAHDRAILTAVEECYDNAMISDATWARLAERLDERQLMELPMVIGLYQAVAYSQNSLRLRLQPDNPGLKAR